LFVWLSLTLLPVERYVAHLEKFLRRNVTARYILFAEIAVIWAWVTCRFRGGSGPFHIRDLAGTIWHGYPFPIEDWVLILNPPSSLIRETHWAGLAGDLLILIATLSAAVRWMRRAGAEIELARASWLAGFAVVFVWLNVDVWVGALPLTWMGSPLIGPRSELHRGFPFQFEHLLPVPDWHWLPLAINVAIAVLAWAAVYGSRCAARRLRSKLPQ
jgi:hypothetical protein